VNVGSESKLSGIHSGEISMQHLLGWILGAFVVASAFSACGGESEDTGTAGSGGNAGSDSGLGGELRDRRTVRLVVHGV
jgi:hypothetical protein